jgi:hypothetical protein
MAGLCIATAQVEKTWKVVNWLLICIKKQHLPREEDAVFIALAFLFHYSNSKI